MSVEDSVARDQLRAFVERIERMNEEKAAINADISDIYKEAKGNGFDTKVLKKIIADRSKDANERMEFDALYELYAVALDMVAEPDFDEPRVQVQARVREGIPSATREHDAETGEITEPQPAKAAGQAPAAADVRNAPSAGFSPSLPGVEGAADPDQITEQQVAPQPASDLTSPSQAPGQVAPIQPETANEKPIEDNERLDDLASVQDGLKMSSDGAAAVQQSANMNADGQGVTGGESAATKFDARKLRPDCQQPFACRGMGREHCFRCKKAKAESEAA